MPFLSSSLLLVALQMLLYALMWSGAWLVLRDERRAIGFWLVSALLTAGSLLLIGMRPHGSPWLTEVLGNVLALAAFLAMWRGAQQFVGLSGRFGVEQVALLTGVGVVLSLVQAAGLDSNGVRGLLMPVSLAWVFLRMAQTLHAPLCRQFGPGLAWGTVSAPLVFGLLNVLRLGLGLTGVTAAVHQAGGVNAVMFVTGLVTAAVFNFLFLFLVVVRLLGRLTFLAERDPLTGLFNRRVMQALLERQWQRHRTSGESFALVSVDVDHFKRINDRYGHPAGDEVLRSVAQVLQERIRPVDRVARMGGEEFLVLLPGADDRCGAAEAGRLREAVAAQLAPPLLPELRVTASFGVVAPRPDDATVDVLLQRVDAALYTAKQRGRDCVITQDDLVCKAREATQVEPAGAVPPVVSVRITEAA